MRTYWIACRTQCSAAAAAAKSLPSCLTLCNPIDGSPPAHQAPPFLGFSRQEHWSGLPFPPPGDLPHQGLNPGFLCLLHWQAGSLPLVPPRLPCRRRRFNSWVGKIPWRRKWLLIPVFLPGECHGQRSLAGYSPWSHKALNMTERTYYCSHSQY